MDNEIQLFQLSNQHISIYLTNYGATLVSFLVKDKSNQLTDIVLGYGTINEYIKDDYYIGATSGQFANRIEYGQFELNHQQFKLSCNNELHHLHGGSFAWSKQIWTAIQHNEQSISFLLNTSKIDNEYQSTVKVKITYTIIDNELMIDYHATTDKTTIINLTNHSYFNLSGTNENIGKQELQIFADAFFPLLENGTPNQTSLSIKNTVFDFSNAKPISTALNSTDSQIAQAKGIDHFFIKNGAINQLDAVAILFNKTNGLKLTVATTKQGVQIYTGNFLNLIKGKDNQLYNQHSAICFECQAVPNAINHTQYKDLVLLQPNTVYHHQDKFVVAVNT
ncbi:MAG: aldose epimerase family protein [Chitinophagales bacterium]